MNIEHKRVRLGPVSLAYQVAGAGAPLILMHGLAGSARWWARNVEPLARRFRVYVIDLIGFGRSRNGHPFVLDEAAAYLVRWMDLLGIERASIVGHSMGGFIAADLAADFPDRVERLVLVAAAALPFGHGYAQHGIGIAKALLRLQLNFLPVLLADAWCAGPLTLMGAAQALLASDLRPKLACIRKPTLVVWGEHDSIIPLELGKRLCRHLSTDELVVLKGAGHVPMWDCPEAFNRVVMDFLSAGAAFAPDAGSRSTPADRPAAQD